MRISTIWIAKDEEGQSLEDFLQSLKEFYGNKTSITLKDEKEYEFSLRSLVKEDDLYVGLLYKYKRDTSIRTYSPNTRNDGEEKTLGHPLLADSYFCITGKGLMVEEKPPHFGHVMITNILVEMAETVNPKIRYKFSFLNSESAIDDIFKEIKNEKIKSIKFKHIQRNPDPEDENLKKFEDMTVDTKSRSVEFSSPQEGLNPDSSYIEGGKILAKEDKAQFKIETVTEDDTPKTYDTAEGRNKRKLKVPYKDASDRLDKLIAAFKELLRFLK